MLCIPHKGISTKDKVQDINNSSLSKMPKKQINSQQGCVIAIWPNLDSFHLQPIHPRNR
jgi:hypothetical protein